MTQIPDPVVRRIPRDQPDNGAHQHLPSHHLARVRGLSDRQAVIAAMVVNGVTCQDIAFELLLPLRTVQGHLLLALRVLNLSRVEDLTYEVIEAHQAKNLATAATRSVGLKPVAPVRPVSPVDGDCASNSLVALDAAEAEADPSLGEQSTKVADLTLELAVTRTELDEQHQKIQQLHEAVASRDSIGQAKGILMERHKISAAAAFTVLQEESNRSGRRLADVARDLAFSGERSS